MDVKFPFPKAPHTVDEIVIEADGTGVVSRPHQVGNTIKQRKFSVSGVVACVRCPRFADDIVEGEGDKAKTIGQTMGFQGLEHKHFLRKSGKNTGVPKDAKGSIDLPNDFDGAVSARAISGGESVLLKLFPVAPKKDEKKD